MTPNFTERWDALGRGELIPTPDVSNATKTRQYYEPLVKAADVFYCPHNVRTLCR